MASTCSSGQYVKTSRRLALSLAGGALMCVLPQAAKAQTATCSAEADFIYSGPPFAEEGTQYEVNFMLGAGSIQDGTRLRVNRFRFNLDCTDQQLNCTDAGNFGSFAGLVDSTCPTTWTINSTGGDTPNQLVFTADTPFDIPANNSDFCDVRFNVEVLSVGAPILQIGGFDLFQADGSCDNGISAAAQPTGVIATCAICDDGLLCNGLASCNPETGQCVTDPDTVPDCNDGNACTSDRCEEQPGTFVCVNEDVVTPTCDDGSACTTDSCDPSSGECIHNDTVTPTCNDGNVCTTDSCDPESGECINDDTATNCNDGNACTTDSCDPESGECVHEDTVTPTCDDGNACTTDSCNPASGACENRDTVTPTCNDGNACTTDACNVVTGACENNDTVTPTCDDGNACTTDACNPASGACENNDTVTPTCDDGNACTTDACNPASGACENNDTVTPTCDDDNACTTDACNPASGACENNDTITPTCDDGNACTTDSCDPASGACRNEDTVTPTCNDGNNCTADVCDPETGACANNDTTTPSCDDGNACTTDSCNPETGDCMHSDEVTPTCNDGNACTTDSCDPETGACAHNDEVTPTCNDGNACTTDSCDPETGACAHNDEVTPTCNDGNACTTDSCDPETGACAHSDEVTPTCNDGNACTTDSCDPETGACAHSDEVTPTCNDGNACTTDSCDPETGACAHNDEVTPTCNDGDACTDDICNPESGACENLCNPSNDPDLCFVEVGDFIWRDGSGDGAQQAEESGIPGVRINVLLCDPETGTPGGLIGTTTTGAGGDYNFLLPTCTDESLAIEIDPSNFDADGPLNGMSEAPRNAEEDSTDSDCAAGFSDCRTVVRGTSDPNVDCGFSRPGGCLTRTPTYWGVRPKLTSVFLEFTSCGLTLDNVDDGVQNSAVEDLCYCAADARSAGVPKQQLELVRQCAAASLNFVASRRGGGSCGDVVLPNGERMDEVMTECCDTLCTSAPECNTITESGCIEVLKEFNNTEDTLIELPFPFDDLRGHGMRADNAVCAEAKGNRFVNER